MDIVCSKCDEEAVVSDDALFNVIYVCPECGEQLACATASE